MDGLETEVSALKTLVITSTPSMPNRHLHPHLRKGRVGSVGGRGGGGSETESGPPSPAREGHSSLGSLQGEEEKEETCVDPVLRAEYVTWKRSPSMEPSCQFLSRIYREDVTPCLDFPVVELADRVRRAVQVDLDRIFLLVPTYHFLRTTHCVWCRLKLTQKQTLGIVLSWTSQSQAGEVKDTFPGFQIFFQISPEVEHGGAGGGVSHLPAGQKQNSCCL